jgi:hypothetical protein
MGGVIPQSMRLKKIEPKAPQVKTSSLNSCIYGETETRDLLYSVCGEEENANDAIKRLVQCFR